MFLQQQSFQNPLTLSLTKRVWDLGTIISVMTCHEKGFVKLSLSGIGMA